MGITIGQAVEEHDKIKQRYARIDPKLVDDPLDSFDFRKDKFLINPGIYPMKPIKKIYGDIHRNILKDIEEDGINLGFVLGPKKAPGQTYRITDFRPTTYESQMEGETKDYSLLTGAMVYYDNDNNLLKRMSDDDNTPKKLLKKSGKKGRNKAAKKSHRLNPEHEKYAQGAVITFQKEAEPEEEEKDSDKLPAISNRSRGAFNEDEEEYDEPIDHAYPDEISDQQEIQRNNRIDPGSSLDEYEDIEARAIGKENAKYRKN
mmetsp:Transcript_1468/g.1286  ORF Transcript_1468/g.1286 Transcript_1468/m.1286 type:complete len:260 (+) Transcript_1468:251-1030(+)